MPIPFVIGFRFPFRVACMVFSVSQGVAHPAPLGARLLNETRGCVFIANTSLEFII
jgi:hypothetical protein